MLHSFHRSTYIRIIVILIFFANPYFLRGQEPVIIKMTGQPPSIDGRLNDLLWQQSVAFSDFKTLSPDYGLSPSENTIVYLTYDATHLYLAVSCLDNEPEKIKASMTKRDNIDADDWVCVELNPFDEAQTNYFFKVNPLGIQEDGMINLNDQEDLSYDMVWVSQGQVTNEGYTVEIAIPFKSLRFRQKKDVTMGIGIRRNINRKSEIVTFPEFAPGQGSRLAQRQSVTFAGIEYERVVEVIPALTLTRGRSHTDGKWQQDQHLNDFSLTGKLGITSDLVLDATYNPDFSQVESDVAQIDVNLRDALYYSEKRSFFLEGKEDFTFGASESGWWLPVREIINTRTIVDPLLGLKLTGKIGVKNKLSSLFAIDEYPKSLAVEDGDPDGQNAAFSIIRYKRILREDSYIGLIYTGKEQSEFYNRVVGLDGLFRLNGNSRIEYHIFNTANKEAESDDRKTGWAAGLQYKYNSRRFDFDAGIVDVGRNFQSEMGYITRTGLSVIPFTVDYKIYPASDFIRKINVGYIAQYIHDKESDLFETFNWIGVTFNMPRQSSLYFGGNLRNEVYAGRRFNRSYVDGGLGSQIIKQFNINLRVKKGYEIYYDINNPYQGKSNYALLSLEFQPLEKLFSSLSLTYTDFYRNSDGEKIYDYSILRHKTTFQFNKYLFFRGIVEYNSYYKQINSDVLLSFTYIPETVFHIGYGTLHEKVRWEMQEYRPSDNFYPMKRSFFIKASYLWRR